MKKQITFFLTCFSLSLFAQSITITTATTSCYNNCGVSKSGTNTIVDGKTRNIFAGTCNSANFQVIYSINSGGRWEIQFQDGGGWGTDFFNTFDSYPNPPNHTTGTWSLASGGCGGSVTNFSGTGTQATLPVELTAFDAQNTKGSNRLAWTTVSEKENQGFDIERSFDGADFEKIAFVKGAGTTNVTQQYTYTDVSVQSAVTYYRLKQVDTDGKFEYSKVVSVESKGDGLKVYPTLVSEGVLTVQGGQSDDFIVTNLFGQTVLIGKISAQINVSNLAKGTYLLKIGSEVTKFVKQ